MRIPPLMGGPARFLRWVIEPDLRNMRLERFREIFERRAMVGLLF